MGNVVISPSEGFVLQLKFIDAIMGRISSGTIYSDVWGIQLLIS